MIASQSTRQSLPTLLTFLTALRASSGCNFADWEAEAAAGCAGYASGTCQALARCGAAFLTPYGSYETCEAQLSEGCTYSLGQPDVFGSGAGAALCGEMMLHADCDAISNGELPLGCQSPSGKRSDGARCRVGSQCASARCADVDGGWGVCRERVEIGEACTTQADCESGLSCSPLGTCVTLGYRGDVCDVGQPCRSPFACVAGECTGVDAAPSCQTFADALCKQLAKCSATVVQSVYGDHRTCTERNALSCQSSLDMAGVGGIGIAGCTVALAAVSCQGLLDHALPRECQLLPGERADGRACNSDGQCASTRCARGAAGTACGICSSLGAIGSPCVADSDCSMGMICGGAACRVPGALGASCDAAQRCAYPWTCGPSGSCVEAVGLGAACSYPADRCNRNDGLMCSVAGVCEPWLRASSGQACNQTQNGWAVCGGGSTCVKTGEGDACSGPVPDGSPCDAKQGPFCLAPAQCLDGVCALAHLVYCQ